MTSDRAVLDLIASLERTATPYMLVGSLSVNAYAFPRSTQDADFVIALRPNAMRPLLDELKGRFRVESQMTFETVTATTRFITYSIETGFKIELFLLSDDPHDLQRFDRRRRVAIDDVQVWVASAEDVIITKLRWSRQGRRTKDADDVRNVIAVQQDQLDWEYIYHWCDQHGTRELVDQIRATVPRID